MMVAGIILLVLMILPFVNPMVIPRDGLPWTHTWAAILGLFFTGGGFALLVVSREDEKERNRAE